jgi:hypothetical protein
MSELETVGAKSEPGYLVVDIKVSSYRLREQLAIEVRDSSLALVGQLNSGRSLALAPGYYHVKAILDDGRAHTKVVRVKSRETKTVEFEVEPTSFMETLGPTRTKRNWAPDTLGTSLESSSLESIAEMHLGPAPVEVAVSVHEAHDYWLFYPPGQLSAVPWVSVAGAFISLPVNPRGHTPTERAALVNVVEHEMGSSARAWVHPDRKLTSALQHMLGERRVYQAQTVAEATAEDLLYDKYSDPVGAALGAIVLHRAGTLDKRIAWLENLAHDFDWLPDGKILLAAQLSVQRDTSRAFELFNRAAKQRPMFTASFGILLEALRRWPQDSEHRVNASQLAENLGRIAADVDWTAFTLTTTDGPQWPWTT